MEQVLLLRVWSLSLCPFPLAHGYVGWNVGVYLSKAEREGQCQERTSKRRIEAKVLTGYIRVSTVIIFPPIALQRAFNSFHSPFS